MDFKNWVISIQTAGYIGARTVHNMTTNNCRFLAYFDPKQYNSVMPLAGGLGVL